MRALILWYKKWAHKYLKQISTFQKSNIPVHNLIFELCTGLFIYLLFIFPLQKYFPFRFLGFLLSPYNSIFIFTSQKSSQFVGKYLCRPQSNRSSIKNRVLSYLHFIIFSSILLSKSHNFNIWKKITHSIMANKVGRVHKLGR